MAAKLPPARYDLSSRLLHTSLHRPRTQRSRPSTLPSHLVSTIDNPLVGPPPREVPLSNAPLIRVIAQVRFPAITSILKREFIAPFQEAIRSSYAVLRPDAIQTVAFGPGVTVGQSGGIVWRFIDIDRTWRLSLAQDFLALETIHYVSRDDLLARFEDVLIAMRDHVNPRVVDRVGVRYIDRVEDENLLDVLPQLVKPQVAGILSTPLGAHARHAIAENVFELPDGTGNLTARWGLVPARATIDPAAIEPIEQPSWLLDLDAYQVRTHAFEVNAVLARAREFTERIYGVFRWAVTEEFLVRYGGRP